MVRATTKYTILRRPHYRGVHEVRDLNAVHINQLNIIDMQDKRHWRVLRTEMNFDVLGLFINDVLIRTRKVRKFGF